MNLWPHQKYAIDQAKLAIDDNQRRICIASNTGGGKTLIMVRLIESFSRLGMPVVLYTNRKMLFEQTGRVLESHGISFGMRASGRSGNLFEDVQLAMIQSEISGVYRSARRNLHNAKAVLIDEAHNNASGGIEIIVRDHLDRGATAIGFTATPLGIGHMYNHLIQAGTTSELRKCGALVPCHSFGPDEPDLRKIKKTKTGEYTENDIRKVIMTHNIFGRVYDWWKKLNPDATPTILFAPGVAESIYFAEQFRAKGVPSAHIDGDTVWINGTIYESDQAAREEVSRMSESGEVKVVCNRFVLREGIDWPWIRHGIMATVFGSLTSYLQAGGRLLRAHPSLDHVTMQCHGGNYWRHGSLNEDRIWRLDRTCHIESAIREDRFREKKDPEPINCPKCRSWRLTGRSCPHCGYMHTGKSRIVIQSDGSLKEMKGDIFKPRRRADRAGFAEDWRKMYHRAKRAGMTFAQAEALFAKDHYWTYPTRDLPLMPRSDIDWFRKVRDIPASELSG